MSYWWSHEPDVVTDNHVLVLVVVPNGRVQYTHGLWSQIWGWVLELILVEWCLANYFASQFLYLKTVFRMAKVKKIDNTKCWEWCGAIGMVTLCWRNAKWYSHFGKQFCKKVKHTFTIRPGNSTPSYCPKRNENICLHKCLHVNVCSSFIHNHQNLETT